MTFVEAARGWMAVEGRLPVNLTVLFEGEEESASPSMVPFLTANTDELKADIALVCDTSMWDRQTPAITTMLRGLLYEEVIIKAASHDLHSGITAARRATRSTCCRAILADLHDEDGARHGPGLLRRRRRAAAGAEGAVGHARLRREGFPRRRSGLSIPAGETGYSTLEQIWSRPTAEVNGIVGGYTGEGAKTVIPAEGLGQGVVPPRRRAGPGSDPQELPQPSWRRGCRPTARWSSSAMAATARSASRATAAGSRRQNGRSREEWGRPAVLIAMGGSIPIVTQFKRILGMDSLMIGFGLDDDRIHSPNEKYNLTSFHGGIRSWARVLAAIAE